MGDSFDVIQYQVKSLCNKTESNIDLLPLFSVFWTSRLQFWTTRKLSPTYPWISEKNPSFHMPVHNVSRPNRALWRLNQILNPLPDDKFQTLPNWKSLQTTISNFTKMKKKLSKQVENTVGKGEIAHYKQFLLFPQCFQKDCFPGASRCHCVGMG